MPWRIFNREGYGLLEIIRILQSFLKKLKDNYEVDVEVVEIEIIEKQ